MIDEYGTGGIFVTDQLCLQYRVESWIIKRNFGGQISCGASVWIFQMHMPYAEMFLERDGKKWKEPLKKKSRNINIYLSIWISNSIGMENFLMHIIPTTTHLFPSSHMVSMQKRVPLDPLYQNIRKARNSKKSVHNPMSWFKN